MEIFVNGTLCTVTTSNLHALLEELGYGEALVATAVDGTFVPRGARVDTSLSPGACLEILAPMQGG